MARRVHFEDADGDMCSEGEEEVVFAAAAGLLERSVRTGRGSQVYTSGTGERGDERMTLKWLVVNVVCFGTPAERRCRHWAAYVRGARHLSRSSATFRARPACEHTHTREPVVSLAPQSDTSDKEVT